MASDPELLLERADWVRRLAGGLAASAADADDLAQETLLAALERPPRAGVPLGKWLAAVVRNRARSQARGRARRREREQLFADGKGGRGGAMEGGEFEPDRALERLEAHRRLVDAVRALEAPLRDALLWRYFDGLAPREIARQTGLPVRTVHTRLHRGLARLRAELERQEGRPLPAWLPLLLAPDVPRAPAPPPAVGSAATLLGGLLMGTKTQLIAGAALCSGLYLAWRALPADTAEPRPAIAGPAAAPAPAAIASTPAAEPRAPMPVVRAAPEVEPTVDGAVEAETPPPLETPRAVAGSVIDLDGRPVAGVVVGFLPPEAGHPHAGSPIPAEAARATAVSGADGRFELAAERAALVGADGTPAFGHVTVLDPAWSAVFEPLGSRAFGPAEHGAGDPLLLVVAPSVRLSGRVSDPTGAGVGGAVLQMSLQRWDFPDLPEDVQGLRLVTRETAADEQGRFEFLAFGAPKAYLMTQAAGFVPDVRQPPSASTDGLSIVLERPARGGELLAGIVVDPAGAPIEGARIALGFEQSRSDGDGRFVLRLSQQSPDTTLAALKPGYLPALVERRGPDTLAPDAWPEPLVLALGGPPLELAGRVLGEAGEPRAGIEVQLVEKTEFGAVEIPGQPFMTSLAYIEDLLDGDEPHGKPARTDEGGRFAIGGLLSRAYTLRAIDRDRLVAEEFGPFEAGSTGLVLRLTPAPLIPRVAGRVVDLARRPLAEVTANAISWIGGAEHGPHAFGSILYGPSAACDAEGRFAFEGLSTAATHLAFHGEEIAFTEPLPIPPGADLENLEFRLPRRCRLRVELGPEQAHGSFELRDAEGQPLMLFQLEGEYAYSTSSGMIGPDGNSETYSAPETAALCAVELHGGRTLELPVRLVPGVVTLIRP